jgi:hypothetical protein
MVTPHQLPQHPGRPPAGACLACGKRISGEQTVVVQPAVPWCLDCVLSYGKDGDLEVETGVGVSIDLLG